MMLRHKKLILLACLIVVAMATSLGGCDFNHSPHGSFKPIPAQGWNKDLSLSFKPQWGDTTKHHDILISVRHDSNYKYSNLCLVVDLVGYENRLDRRKVNFILADRHGNWLGSGFGSLYQSTLVLGQDIDPKSVKEIVVRQGMNNIDVVAGINDVGIIIE